MPDPYEGKTREEYLAGQDDDPVTKIRKTFNEIQTIQELDTRSHFQAMVRLVDRHRTEYERLVADERTTLGISDEVQSRWLQVIEENEV